LICVNFRRHLKHMNPSMRKIVPPIFLALLSGAGLVIVTRQLPPRPVPKPETPPTQDEFPALEDPKLDFGQPAGLRLQLAPYSLYGAGNALPSGANVAPRWDSRPLSEVKLFEGGGFTAEWHYGGQIQYRIEGLNPLGANVGGRLSTNSARITLSWPTSN
jgi:hypothetical protein